MPRIYYQVYDTVTGHVFAEVYTLADAVWLCQQLTNASPRPAWAYRAVEVAE